MTMSETERKRRSGQEGPGTVRQTIVETVEAPRLTDIDTSDFVMFKQKRVIYERKIAEKNAEEGVQVQLTTYRNSISRAVLEFFVSAGWLKAADAEAVTEEQLKELIERNARIDPADYDLALLESELRHVRMERAGRNSSLERQVWRLCLKYTSKLQKCGYDEFVKKQPKLAVKHLVRRISHPQLKSRMILTLRLRKEDGFGKDYTSFVQELAKEARAVDRQEIAARFATEKDKSGYGFDSESDRELEVAARSLPKHKRQNSVQQWPRQRDAGGNLGENRKTGATTGGVSARNISNKRKRELPVCLNPRCGERHFLNDCPKLSIDEKKRLKREYHDARRQRHGSEEDGKPQGGRAGIRKIEGSFQLENTSLFSASFCSGAVEAVLLADSGSDITVLPPSLFAKLSRADPKLTPKPLEEPMVLKNASLEAASFTCTRQVCLDVELRIRHGERLMLRRVTWLISDVPLSHAYLGRPILSALGLDSRVLLAAARERLGAVVDVSNLMDTQEHAGKEGREGSSIHGILREQGLGWGSTFHGTPPQEHDGLEDEDVYVDLGDDPVADRDAALRKLVDTARVNGISEIGAQRLERMLCKHASVFGFGWESPHQPTFHL